MPTLHPDPARVPPRLHSQQEALSALRTLPPETPGFIRPGLLTAARRWNRTTIPKTPIVEPVSEQAP
jgi:hypothetical protein